MDLPARFTLLPREISSGDMMKYAQPGELLIRLELRGAGNIGAHRIKGRGTRSYRFEWDRKRLNHVLRVPASLWHLEKGAMAYDLLDVPGTRLAYRIVVFADEQQGTATAAAPARASAPPVYPVITDEPPFVPPLMPDPPEEARPPTRHKSKKAKPAPLPL